MALKGAFSQRSENKYRVALLYSFPPIKQIRLEVPCCLLDPLLYVYNLCCSDTSRDMKVIDAYVSTGEKTTGGRHDNREFLTINILPC